MVGNKIKITPQELIAQSDKLYEISVSYKKSMKEVEGILNSVNSNWSKNISNSFSTKIKESTSIISSLTTLIDQSSKAAKNAAESYTTIDKQLEKIISGETEISNTDRTQGPVDFEAFMSHIKGKSIIEILKMVDGSYDSLPKEYRDYIDMVFKSLFGSNAKKITKLLMNMVAGDLKTKDIWDVVDLAGGLLTKGAATKFGFSKFDIIFTTAKTILSNKYYFTATDKYEAEAIARFKDGNIIGGIASIALSLTELGKGVTDVACRLIDKTFKLSEISTAIKLMYGIDLAGEFNVAASYVNIGVDTGVRYINDSYAFVGNMVTSGVKTIGHFIKELF